MTCILWFCCVHIVYLSERAKSRNWLFPNSLLRELHYRFQVNWMQCTPRAHPTLSLLHYLLSIIFCETHITLLSVLVARCCCVINEFVSFLELSLTVIHHSSLLSFKEKRSIFISLSLQVGQGQHLRQTVILQLTIDYIRSEQFHLNQGKNVANDQNLAIINLVQNWKKTKLIKFCHLFQGFWNWSNSCNLECGCNCRFGFDTQGYLLNI